MQWIKHRIDIMVGLHFQAITKKVHKLTDRLANEGTDRKLRLNSRAWQDLEDTELRQHCTSINVEYNHSTKQ